MAMPLVTRAILYTAVLAAMAGAIAAPHSRAVAGPMAQVAPVAAPARS